MNVKSLITCHPIKNDIEIFYIILMPIVLVLCCWLNRSTDEQLLGVAHLPLWIFHLWGYTFVQWNHHRSKALRHIVLMVCHQCVITKSLSYLWKLLLLVYNGLKKGYCLLMWRSQHTIKPIPMLKNFRKVKKCLFVLHKCMLLNNIIIISNSSIVIMTPPKKIVIIFFEVSALRIVEIKSLTLAQLVTRS